MTTQRSFPNQRAVKASRHKALLALALSATLIESASAFAHPMSPPSQSEAASALQQFTSRGDVVRAVERIVAISGLEQNFTIRTRADVDYAAAAISGRERVIYYNVDFFKRLRPDAR